jgi:membrane protein implicated in regulation of membrane protease activity
VEDSELWRWIWLGTTALFTVGEMAAGAGTFFLAPFAGGALVATVIAFAGGGLAAQWAAFVVVSAVAFAAMRPLARRLDLDDSGEGVGSKRLVGQRAVVLDAIPGNHNLGLVQVHREEWRAESLDGLAIPEGEPVKVVEVRGTRVIVVPLTELGGPAPLPPAPAPGPDS